MSKQKKQVLILLTITTAFDFAVNGINVIRIEEGEQEVTLRCAEVAIEEGYADAPEGWSGQSDQASASEEKAKFEAEAEEKARLEVEDEEKAKLEAETEKKSKPEEKAKKAPQNKAKSAPQNKAQ